MITLMRALKLRSLIENAVQTLDDGSALQCVELFPLWTVDIAYSIDSRVSYNKVLYRCVQPHTSQSDWTPDLTPALWSVVTLDEYPQWIQPTGTQDAYNEGDKVSHNDKHWISTVNANVWEPGVYGWVEEGD